MNCGFTTYSGNPYKIDKSGMLNFSDVRSVEAYNDVDDITCEFVVSGVDLHGYNYMYVDWNNHRKYYFIELRSGLKAGMTRIVARCDVLYTYKSAILESPAVLNRTSDGSKGMTFPFLKDNRVTTLAQTEFSSFSLASNIISDTEFVYVGVLQKIASVPN